MKLNQKRKEQQNLDNFWLILIYLRLIREIGCKNGYNWVNNDEEGLMIS